MQKTAYSAFGSIHPVHDPAGKRIRWFCPRLISESKVLGQALGKMTRMDDQTNVTRLTLRVVSHGDLPPGCKDQIANRGFEVEAKIPMGGVRNLVMTYIGKCKQERHSDSDDIQQEQLLLDAILQQERKGPASILEKFCQLADFRVEQLAADNLSTTDFDRLVSMHKEIFPTFPYDFRKKLGMMLRQPDNYRMVIVRSILNGQIYAFSNLELNTLTLDDGSRLCLAEYDNSMRAISCSDHKVIKGLGAVVRLELASIAARCNADLCHSESRASLAAINDISHQIGMCFGGALEKHLLISGQYDIEYMVPSRFETMNVWYLDRKALRSLEVEYRIGLEKFNRAQ